MLATASSVKVKKTVSATDLRENLRTCLATATANAVVLVENRRLDASRYIVDQGWLDDLIREHDSIMATLEILTDRALTKRLLKTAKTVDADLKAGRLRTMEEVFG